ncbi:MAG TPA: hypothetical protein VEF90_17745 [Xanthobacteraceae bacterium]|nr:hypothetical protein [Xanthobacteraceae bacterium]
MLHKFSWGLVLGSVVCSALSALPMPAGIYLFLVNAGCVLALRFAARIEGYQEVTQ